MTIPSDMTLTEDASGRRQSVEEAGRGFYRNGFAILDLQGHDGEVAYLDNFGRTATPIETFGCAGSDDP